MSYIIIFFIFFLTWFIYYKFTPKYNSVVIVFGDLGRSPRMQNHAIALAQSKLYKKIFIFGFLGAKCKDDVENNSKIHLRRISNFEHIRNKNNYLSLFLLSSFLKIITQTIKLVFYLIFIGNIEFILVQNPPSIPTLPLIYNDLRGSSWNLSNVFVLKDLPTDTSRPISLISRHIFFMKYFNNLSELGIQSLKYENIQRLDYINTGELNINDILEGFYPAKNENYSIKKSYIYQEKSLFTKLIKTLDGKMIVKSRSNRMALIVSSTSWTPDENFKILITALKEYDTQNNVPNLLVVITGEGPLKKEFIELMTIENLIKVKVLTGFLPYDDYYRLLAVADIGLSLHTSSSGLDLPMKVMDMLGCGLPVFAFNFNTIKEMITPGINGEVFDTPSGLTQLLIKYLTNFPSNELRELRLSTLKNEPIKWLDAWNHIAKPIFKSNS